MTDKQVLTAIVAAILYQGPSKGNHGLIATNAVNEAKSLIEMVVSQVKD
jgi:hypothetical protein